MTHHTHSQERWLPELQRVVGLINTSFASNFSQIGCAGEVLLGQHEDYDKFSIQVGAGMNHTDWVSAHIQKGRCYSAMGCITTQSCYNWCKFCSLLGWGLLPARSHTRKLVSCSM